MISFITICQGNDVVGWLPPSLFVRSPSASEDVVKRRIWVLTLLILVLSGLVAPTAQAVDRDQWRPDQHLPQRQWEALAAAQTQQLFRFYEGEPQVVSPENCREAGYKRGVFLLPTLSFNAGDRTFWCSLKSGRVLLDLGGIVVSEDNNFATDGGFPLANGESVPFDVENLPQICDEVLQLFQYQPSPGSLDGKPLKPTLVTTGNFEVSVDPGFTNYEESVDLGHPGRLTACYAGWKSLSDLRPGYHRITVDLSAIAAPSSVLTYHLFVRR